MSRIVLFDAAGRPAVSEMSDGEKMAALLVEAFGSAMGIPGAMGRETLLASIVAVVGREAVFARWPQVRMVERPAANQETPA